MPVEAYECIYAMNDEPSIRATCLRGRREGGYLGWSKARFRPG
jgi:hypothetical protein